MLFPNCGIIKSKKGDIEVNITKLVVIILAILVGLALLYSVWKIGVKLKP